MILLLDTLNFYVGPKSKFGRTQVDYIKLEAAIEDYYNSTFTQKVAFANYKFDPTNRYLQYLKTLNYEFNCEERKNCYIDIAYQALTSETDVIVIASDDRTFERLSSYLNCRLLMVGFNIKNETSTICDTLALDESYLVAKK